VRPRKENELSRYRDTLFKRDKDKEHDPHLPLLWWKERQEIFPTLAQLARSVLGARPTSASVERLFSSAKNLVTPLRTRMHTDRIELWLLNRYHQK